jgi:hypothetical protein
MQCGKHRLIGSSGERHRRQQRDQRDRARRRLRLRTRDPVRARHGRRARGPRLLESAGRLADTTDFDRFGADYLPVHLGIHFIEVGRERVLP